MKSQIDQIIGQVLTENNKHWLNAEHAQWNINEGRVPITRKDVYDIIQKLPIHIEGNNIHANITKECIIKIKQMKAIDKIILIHYVDVGHMSGSEINAHMLKIQEMLHREEQDTINYIIPIQGQTRIECINPKLVSEEDFNKAKEILDKNQKIVDDLVKSFNQEKPSQEIKISEK